MYRALFLYFFFYTSCYKVERNCSSFHTGTFEFQQIFNGELNTSFFVRDSIYEIEMYQGKIDTSTLRWVNNCECILTKLNPTSNQEKRPIRIKILNTQKDSYTFEYSLVGDTKNLKRGIIKKIKN